jgi:hypothetical protein
MLAIAAGICHHPNMCSSERADDEPVLAGLGTDALLDIADRILGLVGREVLSAGVDDAALHASIGRLHRIETRVHAEKLRRIGEFDARQAYLGRARTTADVLAGDLDLTRGEAAAAAETARALQRLPETAAKLADGAIGAGHAREAARGLAQLDEVARHGDPVPDDAAAELDELVAGPAGAPAPTGHRAGLRRQIQEWAQRAAPDDAAERERRAFARRHAWIGATPDGMLTLEAKLDHAGGAHVQAALAALARPTGADDARTGGQRLADALVDLARRHLDGGGLPDVAAQRPHVLLLTTPDALHDQPDAAASTLDGVGAVSGATARQLCCDADVTAVAFDREGHIMGAGRRTRTPNRAQRAAVIARDRGCIGCSAPAAACQIHHVRWWRDLGPTDIDNLVLACWSCHHHIHHYGWRVVRRPAGRYTIHRPATTDPPLRRTA